MKRIFDLVLASAGLVMLSPVMAALADASGLGVRPSISQPQTGFDRSAGIEATVIMSAPVLRE